MMKVSGFLVVPLVFLAFGSAARASDAHIQLRAYVPTSCSMKFSEDIERISPDSFSLGTVEQFCNTNYQLTLYHTAAPAGAQFRFGDRTVDAGQQSTMLELAGRPIIASKELVAERLDQLSADALGSSMVLQVTPMAL